MPRYRDLPNVEMLFRVAKATRSTRAILHSSDAAIRGHIFSLFLALVLRKELFDRCTEAGLKLERADLLRYLDRLQIGALQKDDTSWKIRTEATESAPDILKAIGIARPPRVSPTSPPLEPVIMLPDRTKRRGQPRRSGTRLNSHDSKAKTKT